MTYKETLEYLYASTPAFHRIGAGAYKPGLDRSLALAKHFKNPEKDYQTIHIAGTNGKGSISHLLAAILKEAGYKTGLYTSPHLVDFCERIRVDGQKISQAYVVDFVKRNKGIIEELQPSFFELVSTLAFDYFRNQKVDIAIIETGLGGRLDSTNIISPILSIITNISLDHTQFLGNSLSQIAFEKAGIMKPNTPVIIGHAGGEERLVFEKQAEVMKSPIFFAEDESVIKSANLTATNNWLFETSVFGSFVGELKGLVQKENAQTVCCALKQLQGKGLLIPMQAVQNGFENVTTLTGLMGRWQKVQENPLVICDTGHNPGAWRFLKEEIQLEAQRHNHLHIVIGMVKDKDINEVLKYLPTNAFYYFTQPCNERAMNVLELAEKAKQLKLNGACYSSVAEAVKAAQNKAEANDFIFIGGSNFVVADALPLFV